MAGQELRVHLAAEVVDDPAGGVEDDRRRQVVDPEGSSRPSPRIVEHRHPEAPLRQEWEDDLRWLFRDGQDGEPLSGPPVQSIEPGKLSDARRTPGGPEAQDHRTPPQVRETYQLARPDLLERDLRSRLSDSKATVWAPSLALDPMEGCHDRAGQHRDPCSVLPQPEEAPPPGWSAVLAALVRYLVLSSAHGAILPFLGPHGGNLVKPGARQPSWVMASPRRAFLPAFDPTPSRVPPPNSRSPDRLRPRSLGTVARLTAFGTLLLLLASGVETAWGTTPSKAGTAGVVFGASRRAEQDLVERWATSKALRDLRIGVSVVETGEGRVLADMRASERLNPASGAKLLTTAAALLALDADMAWVTRIHGLERDGVVSGPLVLVGGGDPKLMPGDIDSLAGAVADRGIRRIEGGILVDASIFDDVMLPPAYDQKGTDAGYRSAIGAAASNFGAVEVLVRPGRRIRDPVQASVVPENGAVVIECSATTINGRRGTPSVAAADLVDGRTRIVVRGEMGVSSPPHSERKRVGDPDLLTAHLLSRSLGLRGVEVLGPIRVERSAAPSDPGPELARHVGASLAATIADINTWSNNFMAEMLLKHLGRLRRPDGTESLPTAGSSLPGPATWAGAVDVATEQLRALGLPADTFSIVNGSGLYRATEVAPSAMTSLLVRMAEDPLRGPPFRASLAVAGRSGTLRSRLTGRSTSGRVLAKTGTLDEVLTLSGYVTARSGRELAFSILVNDARPERASSIRDAIDSLVRSLAEL